MCTHRLTLVRAIKENIKDNMKDNGKGTLGEASDPLLLYHLLLFGLIAVNRADGVQWHLREAFIEVRVEGWGLIDGWKRC